MTDGTVALQVVAAHVYKTIVFVSLQMLSISDVSDSDMHPNCGWFHIDWEAKEVVAKAKSHTGPLWPVAPVAPAFQKAKRDESGQSGYQLQQHGDTLSLRHPILGETSLYKMCSRNIARKYSNMF